MALDPNWNALLKDWQQRRTTSPQDENLRQEFLTRFPLAHLSSLTLDTFAAGKPNSFCFWIEHKLGCFGGIKGLPKPGAKFGLAWNKKEGRWDYDTGLFADEDDALEQIKQALIDLLRHAEREEFAELDARGPLYRKQMFRGKVLFVYFPDRFLPCYQVAHARKFLEALGEQPVSDELMTLNRQLFAVLRSRSEFQGFDTRQQTFFLYTATRADEAGKLDDKVPPGITSVPPVLDRLAQLTELPRTRNIILYGPPGTGKTWLVNHFSNFFLLHHNVGAKKAEDYWDAAVADETAQCQALAEEVRAEREVEAEDQPAFWWITANSVRDWTWEDLFAGKVDGFFEKGQISRHFSQAQPGDVVFGYLARPQSNLAAFAKVKRGLHQRDVQGTLLDGIEIEPLTPLSKPLPWATLVQNPILQSAEPIRCKARGTLFQVTPEEAQELLRLLQVAGGCESLVRKVSAAQPKHPPRSSAGRSMGA